MQFCTGSITSTLARSAIKKTSALTKLHKTSLSLCQISTNAARSQSFVKMALVETLRGLTYATVIRDTNAVQMESNVKVKKGRYIFKKIGSNTKAHYKRDLAWRVLFSTPSDLQNDCHLLYVHTRMLCGH